MIEERKQEDEAHMGLMQLLGALKVNPKQVKDAKGEQAEVSHTHMDKVTKENVNSMGKKKQYSKHQKCRGLHPFEASREKEVKNILVERVTRRQGVALVIEYLVRWKGLPKRHASWEHADSLRRLWKHIERFQEEATTGTSTT